jgi:hypothetical protein
MSDEIGQVAKGAAIIGVCIVQELDRRDPGFQDRFLMRLTEAHSELRDNSSSDAGLALSMIRYMRELLTGFSQVSGQGEPFLGGPVDR